MYGFIIKFFMIIKYVLVDDNLLILILIAQVICLDMNAEWLERTLMYVGIVLLNGL